MATEFAHPVERALARVYDEHGIAWRYESRTFVLERDADGKVLQAFTPDFYLPDVDLYIECTVMRQALTSRKRRKVRLTRERAGAAVEILFRRDFERLARRWGLVELADAINTEVEVLEKIERGKDQPMFDVRDGREGFVVHVEQRAQAAVVTVTGEVDVHSAPEVRDRLASLTNANVRCIVVDLTSATFLDSMALGVLLGAKKRLTDVGGSLALVVATSEIRRIFEITLLDNVFDLYETRDEALSAATQPTQSASSSDG